MPEPAPAPLYLDANASEPPLVEAKNAARRALELIGNPSSPHALGRVVRALVDDARDAVAAMLGAHARDVVFTSGASEANRFVVDLLRSALEPGRTVVTSTMEHPSLKKPLDAAPFVLAPRAALHGPSAALVRAVAITAAHNETGLLVDVDELCRAVRDDVIVCVDAAQATARLPPLPARVDVIVCSAHKLGALPGAGAVVVRGNAKALASPWLGGGQEGGRRPGTENVVGIAALGAAAAAIDDTRRRAQALAPLRDRIERELVRAWHARALGADLPRLPQTTALVVPDVDGEALRIALDLAGVCVGFGSACSALAPEPSPALMALGLSEREARATVRLSLPLHTSESDVDEAMARVRDVPARMRAVSARRG